VIVTHLRMYVLNGVDIVINVLLCVGDQKSIRLGVFNIGFRFIVFIFYYYKRVASDFRISSDCSIC